MATLQSTSISSLAGEDIKIFIDLQRIQRSCKSLPLLISWDRSLPALGIYHLNTFQNTLQHFLLDLKQSKHINIYHTGLTILRAYSCSYVSCVPLHQQKGLKFKYLLTANIIVKCLKYKSMLLITIVNIRVKKCATNMN